MPKKDLALEKIESHENLCRIMQKQTHDKIHKLENKKKRNERKKKRSAGVLLTGMAGVILVLLQKL